jgi:hypothetical protein
MLRNRATTIFLLVVMSWAILYSLVFLESYYGRHRIGIIDYSAELITMNSQNNAELKLTKRDDGNFELRNVGQTDFNNIEITTNGKPIRLFDSIEGRFLSLDKWKKGNSYTIVPAAINNADDCPEIISRKYSYITDDLTVDCKETHILKSDELDVRIEISTKRWNDHFRRDVLGCSDLISYFIPFMCQKNLLRSAIPTS